MAPSWLRAALGGVVVASCILVAAGFALAQTKGTSTPESIDDPVPVDVTATPLPSPIDGHAAEEGLFESAEVRALAAFTQAEATASLRVAIAALETGFVETVQALQAEFDAALDESTAMQLQRRIEELKFEHEVGLVLVQAEHARAMGRAQLADDAERIATRLRAQYRANAAPSDGSTESVDQE